MRPLFPLLALTAPLTVPPPTHAPDDLRELTKKSHSSEPSSRRSAVRALAELGGRDAQRLVLEALADPEPEVADEAQLVLVAFEGDGVVRELLGPAGMRSREPLVRLRAAEAFGRMAGPVDGVKLATRIDRRDPAATRALLWSLERLADRGRLVDDSERLGKKLVGLLGRGADDGVRAVALQVLARVDATASSERIPDLLDSRGSETACSALAAAVLVGHPNALRWVERSLASDVESVRATAVSLTLKVGARRPTLTALNERLASEPREALRGRVLDALRRLTGMKHRADPRAWRHTIERLPSDWVGPILSPASREEAERKQGSVAEISMLPPGSDRLGILVDFSGSLWNERADGTCRKDLLDPEMHTLLGKLDPEGLFYLVPFTSEPHPSTDAPVRASPRNVRTAQRFFARATMRGKGNLYDALMLALEHDELDRLIVLTDGAPTGGHRWNVDLMIELVRERIRFRPVVIDFVLIDTPNRLIRRWRGLAESTGGRVLTVDT